MNDFLVKFQNLPEALPDRPFKYIKEGDPISCPRCGKIGDYIGAIPDTVPREITDVWFNPIRGHWMCSYCFRLEGFKMTDKKGRPAPPIDDDGKLNVQVGDKTVKIQTEDKTGSEPPGEDVKREAKQEAPQGGKPDSSPGDNFPLPCPFCGSDKIRILSGYQFYRYYCNDCEAHSKAAPEPEQALKGWNRRVK